MWQSVEILNFFNTLTLKQIFCKTKTFFKKPEHRFLTQSSKIKNASFSYKIAISEANVMLRQIEWWVQNGPIAKNGVLPVAASFFSKILIHFNNHL